MVGHFDCSHIFNFIRLLWGIPSDMIKGRSPRATGDQKSRMYNEILKRFKESSTNTSSFTILMDILETEAEGFYISKKQFSRIIYQQLKR